MIIALLELNIEWENKKKNINELKQIIDKLKDEHVDLLLLPEMSFTGFSMNVEKTKESSEQTMTEVKKISKESDISIGFGWVKAGAGQCENHYSIVSGEKILLDYVKIHPFSYSQENKFFKSGTQVPTCKCKEFTIGVQICYDLRFPEPFRAISKKAHLVVVPANWPNRRREHWNTLLRARAIENQIYVAAVNCVGEIGEIEYSGDSQLINPNGDVLRGTIMKTNSDSTIYLYNINQDVHRYRNEFPTQSDRRDELYAQFYNGR